MPWFTIHRPFCHGCKIAMCCVIDYWTAIHSLVFVGMNSLHDEQISVLKLFDHFNQNERKDTSRYKLVMHCLCSFVLFRVSRKLVWSCYIISALIIVTGVNHFKIYNEIQLPYKTRLPKGELKQWVQDPDTSFIIINQYLISCSLWWCRSVIVIWIYCGIRVRFYSII